MSGNDTDDDRAAMSRMLAPHNGRRPPVAMLMLAPDSGRRPPMQTFMLAPQNGRSGGNTSRFVRFDAAIGDVHAGVVCDACDRPLGSAVRYKCLDCADFDLCDDCVNGGADADRAHCGGAHVFAKIVDSTTVPPARLQQHMQRR